MKVRPVYPIVSQISHVSHDIEFSDGKTFTRRIDVYNNYVEWISVSDGLPYARSVLSGHEHERIERAFQERIRQSPKLYLVQKKDFITRLLEFLRLKK